MPRSPLPGPATRKNILLLNDLWARIAAYRHARQIGTEMEALRRLVGRGLDADAEIARLRALLAAAGLDPDKGEGGTP